MKCWKQRVDVALRIHIRVNVQRWPGHSLDHREGTRPGALQAFGVGSGAGAARHPAPSSSICSRFTISAVPVPFCSRSSFAAGQVGATLVGMVHPTRSPPQTNGSRSTIPCLALALLAIASCTTGLVITGRCVCVCCYLTSRTSGSSTSACYAAGDVMFMLWLRGNPCCCFPYLHSQLDATVVPRGRALTGARSQTYEPCPIQGCVTQPLFCALLP
jgi:hypothetical protein